MMPRNQASADERLQSQIVSCRLCPRLRRHCQRIAVEKRRAYRHWEYWGKPVPSFGPIDARVLIIGLAPGAHGANRTGRMFTGDRSGDFLYRALYETGFANQPTSQAADDGLELIDCRITAPVHCAPPQNRPTGGEFAACRPYLERELELLSELRAVVALGRLALRAHLGILKDRGHLSSLAKHPFTHGGVLRFCGLPPIVCSYHPSQQNTQTGRLTREMLREALLTARDLAGLERAV